jgi:hypothetical protein
MIQYISETFPDADLSGYTTPGWYFWDETQAHCYGPFATRDDAVCAASEYADQL